MWGWFSVPEWLLRYTWCYYVTIWGAGVSKPNVERDVQRTALCRRITPKAFIRRGGPRKDSWPSRFPCEIIDIRCTASAWAHLFLGVCWDDRLIAPGCSALSGLSGFGRADPGRRFALPWADMLRPLRGNSGM